MTSAQAMKSRLAAIRWDSLRDAYGPASSVPKRILELTRASKAAREEALEQLWMGLCHQRASLSEASAHAVPFLLELGVAPDTRSRGGILELLQGMAEVVARSQTPEAAATSGALSAHSPELLALLSAADADVRARAALILAQLATRDAALRTRLERELSQRYAAERPPHPHGPAGQTAAAAKRGDDSSAVRTALVAAAEAIDAVPLLRAALDDAAFAPRLAAALALLKHDAPPSPAFRVVQDALEDLQRTRAEYGSASRYKPLDFARSAQAAGPHAASVILPALLALLARSSAYEAQDDLEPLLQVFFPSGASAAPSREQAAIAAVAADNRSYFGNLGNATALLGRYGLPTRPRPLRAYAARGPADHGELLPKLTRAAASPEVLFQRLLGYDEDKDEVKDKNEDDDNAKHDSDVLESASLIGDASDELLAKLGRLSKLEYLTIKSSQVSARGFAALPALESLTLEDLSLDEPAARAIAELTLQQLSLQDVTLDDSALAALGASTTLQEFMLLTSPVPGLGFEGFRSSPVRLLVLGRDLGLSSHALVAIAKLPRLHTLRVIASGVQEDWLAVLAECGTLQELQLRELTLTRPLRLPSSVTSLRLPRCAVPLQLLAALVEQPQLKQLDLEHVQLSSQHVAALAALAGRGNGPHLESLKLSESCIEPAALAELRAALPDVQLRVLSPLVQRR